MNRYENYTDTGIDWIGEIPKHWEKISVRHLTSDHRQGFYTSDFYDENGIPILRITDINDDHTFSHENSPRYDRPTDEVKNFYVNQGDFLFPRTGGVGRFGIVDFDFPCIYGSFMIRFRFIDTVQSEFLKFYFESDLFLNQVKREIHGGVNQNVHVENIKNCFVYLPQNHEQKFISGYLDKKTEQIDALIAKVQKKIELLKEQRTSLINHCITKGLNPNVEMKDSGIEWIGEIPKHWVMKKLKHLVSYNQDTLSENTNPEYQFHYIEIGDIDYINGVTITDKITFGGSPSRARRVVLINDVIVSTVRTYLRAIGVIPDLQDVVCSTGFCVLRGNPKELHQYFLSYSVRSEWFISKVIGNSYGVSYPAINSSELVELKIVVPPLSEQKFISGYLDKKTQKIDHMVELETQRISKLREYRQSLISSVVTGQIDVSTWSRSGTTDRQLDAIQTEIN